MDADDGLKSREKTRILVLARHLRTRVHIATRIRYVVQCIKLLSICNEKARGNRSDPTATAIEEDGLYSHVVQYNIMLLQKYNNNYMYRTGKG